MYKNSSIAALLLFGASVSCALLWKSQSRKAPAGAKKEVKKNPDSIKNSVKPYARHCIVFGAGVPDSWNDRIETLGPSSASPRNAATSQNLTVELIEKIKSHQAKTIPQGQDKPVVTVTCSSEPSNCEVGYHDICVYPEEIIFSVAPSNLDRFVEIVTNSKRVMIDALDKSIFKATPVPWSHLIAVCSHSNRDQRCGRIGPTVISSLESAIKNNNNNKAITTTSSTKTNIKVIDTSHIGGHKYAGTLVVYPQADWYGLVTPKGDSIAKIIEDVNSSVSSEQCYDRCHRGRNVLAEW